ncbi:MAG: O-antigen ligase family protein [Patescibacteria group bacterium]|nr:O-antigen ligase family protein [Patescibacteria group bacterium]
MLNLNKIRGYIFLSFFFLLPFQTRWIWHYGELNGGFWEFGSYCVYATEILLLSAIVLSSVGKFNKGNIRQWTMNKKSVLLFFCAVILSLLSFYIFKFSLNWKIATQHFMWLIEGIFLFFILFGLNDKSRFARALWLGGVAQGILAVWQFFSQDVFASKWLGLSGHISSDLGANVIEFGDERWLRAYGSLGGANPLGIYLAVLLVLGLTMYLRENNFKIKILISFGQLIILSGLLLSFSRGAWLAALVGAAAVWAVVLLKKEKIPCVKENIFKQFIFYAFIVIIFFFAFKPLFFTRFDFTNRLESMSILTRESQVKESLEIWKNHPFFGVGLGNYTLTLYQKKSNLPVWQYQPVHNMYLMILAETGIVGFLIFMTFLFLIAKNVFKSNILFLPVLATLFVGGFFEYFYFGLCVGILFWWAVVGLGIVDKNQISNCHS